MVALPRSSVKAPDPCRRRPVPDGTSDRPDSNPVKTRKFGPIGGPCKSRVMTCTKVAESASPPCPDAHHPELAVERLSRRTEGLSRGLSVWVLKRSPKPSVLLLNRGGFGGPVGDAVINRRRTAGLDHAVGNSVPDRG